MSKKTWVFFNFEVFWSLCFFGAILAHQTSDFMFSKSWGIFWHPWDPWGRVNSGDISFLVFVFDFSVWQRHLAEFFHFSQIEARCHLYWFDMYKSHNITFYSQNGWIFKVIQARSVVIWMETEEISPVWYQGGVKSTVSWIFEDLKFKISEESDQNWCFPDPARLAVSV